MKLDVARLRESLPNLLRHRERFGERFYELLFTRFPAFKTIFLRVDLLTQPQHFVRALEVIVALADEPDCLINYLRATGARHLQYDVAPRDFPCVVPLLLKTMEEILGREQWSKYHAAWNDALQFIVAEMSAGAAAAQELASRSDDWDDWEVPMFPPAPAVPPASTFGSRQSTAAPRDFADHPREPPSAVALQDIIDRIRLLFASAQEAWTEPLLSRGEMRRLSEQAAALASDLSTFCQHLAEALREPHRSPIPGSDLVAPHFDAHKASQERSSAARVPAVAGADEHRPTSIAGPE